jgi:L-alanine-DL-glutamate epimerase-like enolase superfamily enzyme
MAENRGGDFLSVFEHAAAGAPGGRMATISGIEAIPLREPDEHGGEETVLVVVRTNNGVEGYGEAVARPDAVRAIVESDRPDPIGWDAGVRWLLEGEDARDPGRLWRKLKDATFWSCRAGVGHCALAGVEMRGAPPRQPQTRPPAARRGRLSRGG